MQKILVYLFTAVLIFITAISSKAADTSPAHPKVILISLDGATPRLVDKYLKHTDTVNGGLEWLESQGLIAKRNITISPSLTAPSHTAIATGSNAAKNDINANGFHLVTSKFNQNINGFAAPIGGYSIGSTATINQKPTAEPLWKGLRKRGKKVVTATFPGADGQDIFEPNSKKLIQANALRTVDYTVPFGAPAGVAAKAFNLSRQDFTVASSTIIDSIKTVFRPYSPVLQTSLEKFTLGINYDIQVAAIDTSNDSQVNYDTLIFFDASQGIKPPAPHPPATGSAFVRNNQSSPFYLEGSPNHAGTRFYISNLAPDLSTVRVVRYGVNYIPPTPSVSETVDDINNHVGFWSPSPDFRITQRLTLGLANFSDREIEAIYGDQVQTFVDYQTRIAMRAIKQNPNADLVMVYIEQPDGSSHQFLLTDPRQATDPHNPKTIGAGQDQEKIARYNTYIQIAYQTANQAVQRIINEVGTNKSNIIVVSDHGFAPFHTAVDLKTLLTQNGFDPTKVKAVTSGPAVNLYINLKGREADGIVSPEEYVILQQQLVDTLKKAADKNPNYTLGEQNVALFDKIYTRPVAKLNDPSFGLNTSEFIGQDSGDVFAILNIGYNFDGIQKPAVQRLDDTPETNPVLSIPSFYGAHGYDPNNPLMSAIFYAAGPNIPHKTLAQVRNIDVAPTINKLLGVRSASTVQGENILKRGGALR